MARLPTAADLSAPASLRSGRMISSADTSAIGRGLEAFGAGIQSLGETLKQRQRVVEGTRAAALLETESIALENSFDTDTAYDTQEKRASEGARSSLNRASQLISDRKTREIFVAQNQGAVARVVDRVRDRGLALSQENARVKMAEGLQLQANILADPSLDLDRRNKSRQEIEASIQLAQETALLSPAQAAAWREKYVTNANVARISQAAEQTPEQFISPNVSGRAATAMQFFTSRGYTKEQAAGIVGNLIAESNLRPSGAVGDGGTAFGIAQWRGERVNRLKRYAASQGKDWQDFGTQLAFVDVELQNHETSTYQALKNAKTVDEATAAFIGYERPRGWTSANPRAGHNYSGRLRNATAAASGAAISGTVADPIDGWSELSPQERFAAEKIARAAMDRRNAEGRAAIDLAVDNAPAAIASTGTYSGQLPTLEQFSSAYGATEGGQRYQQFQTAVETASEVHGMQTATAAEIQGAVAAARPTSSGNDAALEQRRYDVLSAAAAATLKAREDDPVTYSQRAFPRVQQAWEAADEPGGFQTALALTAATQKQLGITNIRLLPAQIATQATKAFNNVNMPEDQRVKAVTDILFSTTDPAQQRAIVQQLIDEGLPEMTASAFNAFVRGDAAAGRRLMQAAMIDPDKLPGSLPEDVTMTTINEKIQELVMNDGRIGDVYYGISDGTVDNMRAAITDSRLLANAANMRIRGGQSVDDAVMTAARDLFGDVKAVTGSDRVNARVLIPFTENADEYDDGFAGLMPRVSAALNEAMTIPENVPSADGTRAIFDATSANYKNMVLAEGYFVNHGDGFAFLDPFTGGVISGPDGKPLLFTASDVKGAGVAFRAGLVPQPYDEEVKRLNERANTSGMFLWDNPEPVIPEDGGE